MAASRVWCWFLVGSLALWAACDPGAIEGFGSEDSGAGGGRNEAGATIGDGGGSNQQYDYKMPPKPPPSKEICNGFDDDQDGEVDEGCGCKLGSTKECYPGPQITIQGICKKGTMTCSKGTSEFGSWGPCSGAVVARAEICGDNIDQDCDGKDFPCPPKCGDGKCNGKENCNTCPQDCGKCDVKKCEGFLFGISARPVDIVWMIDQSGSMSQEISGVKQNMNNFAKSIAYAKNDYRVIVLAKRGTGSYDICIPPPLGGSSCGDSTRFKQVSYKVGSTNALTAYQSYASSIEAFMRPTSLRLLVVVTDDNSSLGASSFHGWIKKRPGYNDYVFHSIVSMKKDWCTAKNGSVYMQLSGWTKGMQFHICNANWNSLFQQLGQKAGDIAKTKYKLAKTAIAGSISVSINGNPKKLGVDYDWDAANNQVIIKGKLPANGAKILICYKHKP